MIDRAVHPAEGGNLETVLRHELARGDAMAQAARPVLSQLVAADVSLRLTDEIVARIRGMLESIARTVLDALPEPALDFEPLLRALIDSPALISHLHCVAMEWHMAEGLQARLALDPAVSPLLEKLVCDDDAGLRTLAAKFLAAQARWCRLQGEMRLSLTELPGELFHVVLLILRAQVAHHPGAAESAVRAEAELCKRLDGAERRLDLGRQLISALDDGAQAALSLSHAGVALFLTALAMISGRDREEVVVWTDEAQLPRLALLLRSLGLGAEEIERQLVALHPQAALPRGFGALDPGHAAALLNTGRGGN